MTRFSEMVYTRPDMTRLTEEMRQVIKEFDRAETADAQIRLIDAFDRLSRAFDTQRSLASVRNTIDTRDEFYEKEVGFFDEVTPSFEELSVAFGAQMIHSPFRAELEEVFGKQIFALTELKLKTFRPEIMDDLVRLNKLETEHTKLIASAQIEFEGGVYTLAQLAPFMQDTCRERRRRAGEAFFGFFEAHEEEMDGIYDRMVQIRTAIARKLGYENFVQLGYDMLGRTDYTADDVRKYRDQVFRVLVPLCAGLIDRQRRRLGLDHLFWYDEPLNYTTGNAVPQGDADWILERAGTMYRELSPETDEFFRFMRGNELFDVLSKKGKAGGGYCTSFVDYKAPFIFANFNGTQGDVEVMTHEAGHAFQGYESRHMRLMAYGFPTLEACEIHSMSMEFFTWPWMELFFEHQTEKFKFAHLAGSLTFIPYGVTVDEFQHWVYENPEATPAERKLKWRELEKKYLPHRDYDGFDYLERGGYWMRQHHIFGAPFYYIDYTLAQVCAMQFWVKNRKNHEEAWNDYLRLCRAGGSRPFLELLELANLRNPFTEGTIASVVPALKEYLNGVDDRAL